MIPVIKIIKCSYFLKNGTDRLMVVNSGGKVCFCYIESYHLREVKHEGDIRVEFILVFYDKAKCIVVRAGDGFKKNFSQLFFGVRTLRSG